VKRELIAAGIALGESPNASWFNLHLVNGGRKELIFW
jgi:hypothetical protein